MDDSPRLTEEHIRRELTSLGFPASLVHPPLETFNRMLWIFRKLFPELHNLVKEHNDLMSDVSQLTQDLDSLKQAVTDDQNAIAAVKSFVDSQQTEITNLEQQVAELQAAGTDLDLSGLEASIAALKTQNQALSAIPDPELEQFLNSLGEKHVRLVADKNFMSEIEFLDEPDVNKRFFRYGTDKSMMHNPKQVAPEELATGNWLEKWGGW